jgi:N-acetylmuramoyl-L-alanine amidase
MKKFVSFILILSMIFSFLHTVKGDVEQVLLSCNTNGTNVRSKAGTKASIVFKLSYGEYVLQSTTVKDNTGAVWYQIYDFNTNKSGFVASWLLDSTGITIKGADANFIARVNTESLNIRAGPGREFTLITTLSQGTKINVVRVITRSDKEEWYKFKGNSGKYYFVASWYTEKLSSPTIPTTPITPTTPTNNVQVATASDYVNLRTGPSTDYVKLALIDKGDSVQIVGAAKNESGELWVQVVYKGSQGWTSVQYFKIDKPVNVDTTFIGGSGTTQDAVSVRECPATTSNVQSVLKKGASINILGIAINKEKETWYEISVDSKYGWVRSDLISANKKEKGILQSVLWGITPNGIDVNISGWSLPNPHVSLLENPLRLTITFGGTSLLKDNGSLEINVYPINRVRYESNNDSVIVTADLTREIPYQVEFKSNSLTVLHLTLPKEGQKLVEISGREIYANVKLLNGESYVDLSDFTRAFNIIANTDGGSFDFFGNAIAIDKSKLLKSDSSTFIAISDLASLFNVSVFETEHEIYIDPILIDYSKSDNIINLKFSFPTDAKKISESGKNYIAFYADFGSFSLPDCKKRDVNNPPRILFEVGPNASIDAHDNIVKITLDASIKSGKLSHKTIVIDPGHGSYTGPYLDVGATGPTGVKEAYVVLDIALRLQKLLEADGAKVILTHTTVDNHSNPTLAERVAIANGSGGDLFLSIHLNASIESDGNGTETYYWYDTSKKYAQTIQNALVQTLGTSDRGIKKDDLYVCKNVTTMPSVLAEIVFVSNPNEEAKCKNSSFLDSVAQALKKGIEDYLNG